MAAGAAGGLAAAPAELGAGALLGGALLGGALLPGAAAAAGAAGAAAAAGAAPGAANAGKDCHASASVAAHESTVRRWKTMWSCAAA